MIVGEDGYLYVIKDGVWKISPKGEMAEVLSSTQFPEGGRPLCIDRQANIYFVNSVKSVAEIYRRTPDGKVSLLASSGGAQQQTQTMAQSRIRTVLSQFSDDSSHS